MEPGGITNLSPDNYSLVKMKGKMFGKWVKAWHEFVYYFLNFQFFFGNGSKWRKTEKVLWFKKLSLKKILSDVINWIVIFF